MLARKSVALLTPLFVLGLSQTCIAGDEPTSAAPFVTVTQRDTVAFKQPSKTTLQTWHVESAGTGQVEVRAWYITGGKAIICDQQLLDWDKAQAGHWRVLLLNQTAPNTSAASSLGLQTVFDSGKPNSVASGVADSVVRSKVRLQALPGVTSSISHANIAPNQPFVLYAAYTKADPATFSRAALQNPALLERLTQRSKTPGWSFTLVTLNWKPATPTAVAAK